VSAPRRSWGTRLFRVARPADPRWVAAKTGVQIVGVWGFALGLLPALAVRADRRVGLPRVHGRGQIPVGAALFTAGSALGLASAWVMAQRGRGTPVPFDAARDLVVAGPYRVVRNPMVVGAIAQSSGIALALGSPTAATIPVAGVLVWTRLLQPPEEAFLTERFGAPYRRYQAAVRCWVPTWPPYRDAEPG
jgi:protein-S-isoprenylcysteine O-methyltransferase Ste14